MIDVPIAEFPVCALVAHVRHLEAVCSHRKQNIITIHKNENTTTTTNNMTNPFLSLIQHNRKYFKDHGFPKLDEPDDAAGADFKGFCMIVHPIHGLLLLHCTRKKDKGPHYQLPGGHVDKEDFDAIATSSSEEHRLILAGRTGCAREVFEETGMKLDPERFIPIQINNKTTTNLHKHRLYYGVVCEDGDFFQTDPNSSVPLFRPDGTHGKDLLLKISHEHTGWIFEPDPKKAVTLIEPHSGGKPSKALAAALEKISN